jgi:hypothetical protein
MLKETFQSIAAAARTVLKNWKSTLLIAIVYAALLAVLYFFVVIREATFVQVSLTFASAIAAPLLFFILQTMIASEAHESAGSMLRKSLTSFWKLILITLPLIAVGVLIVYLLGKAQARFDANVSNAATALPRRVSALANARDATPPIDWRAASLSTLRYLAFGLVLPLAAIHLWLATAKEGLGPAIKKLKTLLARTFAPQSILVYIAGFLVFAVIPYFLLFRTISTKNAWLELSFMIVRLAVVFALTLFGWLMTVKAISLLSAGPLSTTPPDPAPEAI